MRTCTECDQQNIVEQYETLLKDVLVLFSATPHEKSDYEWVMTDRRVAALANIRVALEAQDS